MKNITMLMILLLAGCGTFLFGQTAITRSAFNIEGTGARALGMGGAFIAVADDATAASWNPAGLAQLTKPEASMVYDHFSGDLKWKESGTVTYNMPHYLDYNYHDINDKATTSYSDFSFVSVTYPFEIGNRFLVTQFSYNQISNLPDFSNKYGYAYDFVHDDGSAYGERLYDYTWKGSASGGINAYTLSLASELFKGFNLGLSLNYLKADVTNTYSSAYTYTESWAGGTSGSGWENDSLKYDFKDWYFDFGMLYKINEMFSVGAVYHSSFTTDLNYSQSISDPTGTTPWNPKGEVKWPDGWGVGIAFRPIQPLTFAADYSKTMWSKATVKWDDPTITPPTTYFPYFWYDKQYDTGSTRLGAEYALVLQSGLVIPFRAGWFKEDQISTYYIGSGQVSVDGYTLGTGVTYKNFQFDVAYVHSTGNEKISDTTTGTTDGFPYTNVFTGKHDTSVDRFLASAIVRF